MKYLIIMLFIPLAFAQVQTGDMLKANDYNNSTFIVGDIKQSLLTVPQFQNIVGDCWVRMEGQDISGSDYATITGKTTLPDMVNQGTFLRQAKTGVNIGTYENDQANSIYSMYVTSTRYYNYNMEAVIPENGTWSGWLADGAHSASGSFSKRMRKKGVETRPKNFSINMFIKINKECN